MCSCRSPLRRACPPPPHIKKAFDLKWYKVTRRAPKGHGIRVYDPPSPRPSPPLRRGERVEGVGGCNTKFSVEGFRMVRGTFWAGTA